MTPQIPPADIATVDQTHAEYQQHLAGMLPAARNAVAEHGPALGMAVLAGAILDDPGWDRETLAAVLATALIGHVQ